MNLEEKRELANSTYEIVRAKVAAQKVAQATMMQAKRLEYAKIARPADSSSGEEEILQVVTGKKQPTQEEVEKQQKHQQEEFDKMKATFTPDQKKLWTSWSNAVSRYTQKKNADGSYKNSKQGQDLKKSITKKKAALVEMAEERIKEMKRTLDAAEAPKKTGFKIKLNLGSIKKAAEAQERAARSKQLEKELDDHAAVNRTIADELYANVKNETEFRSQLFNAIRPRYLGLPEAKINGLVEEQMDRIFKRSSPETTASVSEIEEPDTSISEAVEEPMEDVPPLENLSYPSEDFAPPDKPEASIKIFSPDSALSDRTKTSKNLLRLQERFGQSSTQRKKAEREVGELSDS